TQTQSAFGDSSGVTCLDFVVTPGHAPTTTYTLTVADRNSCTRTATTSLDVRQSPTASAGPDQMICTAGATTSFTLAGTASNGTGAWSIVSGPVSIANPNALNSSVTFTGTGTATLRLTVTSNANPPCSAVADNVVLTVNGNPTAAAGPGQAKCSAGATTPF